MDGVYVKLIAVFVALTALRLALFMRRVPVRVRTVVAEYTDSGIVASLVAIFVVTFLLQISRVEGISMQPTLLGGEYALVNKVTYRFSAPRRGDVVVFQAPDDPGADYIKRVIALPGELVEVRDGVVFVNGAPLEERYATEPPDYDLPPMRVPESHLFVLGDNRNHSYDSHLWSPPFLPLRALRGKASLVLWPLAEMGGMPGLPISALAAETDAHP